MQVPLLLRLPYLLLPATVLARRRSWLQQQAVQTPLLRLLQLLLPLTETAPRHRRLQQQAVQVLLMLAVLLKMHPRCSMAQRHLLVASQQRTSQLQATQ
jgi:hypothetical protein